MDSKAYGGGMLVKVLVSFNLSVLLLDHDQLGLIINTFFGDAGIEPNFCLQLTSHLLRTGRAPHTPKTIII